jgi:hypothetical protein
MSQLNLTSGGVETFAGAFENLLIELLALNIEVSNEEILESTTKLISELANISLDPLTKMRDDPEFQNYARLFQASIKEKATDEDSEAASV